MIKKAKCIALHTVRFGETSLVAYVYSQEYGRVSLMVNNAYGKGKNAKKAIYFQPLNIIEIVFYPGKAQTLAKLKEVSISQTNTALHLNPVKSAIALFIGEIIYRTIREEESNPSLFRFLEISIQTLDALEHGISNFHLIFLSQLTKYLGFYPSGSHTSSTPYFDYKNGLYVSAEPVHPMFFTLEQSRILSLTLTTTYTDAHELKLNGRQRNEFLTNMLNFFSYHMDTVQSMKSLAVLNQVFEE